MLGGIMQSIGVGGTVEASELNLSSGNVGIGTTSPGNINSTSFSFVKLHEYDESGQIRSVIDGNGRSELLLNDQAASLNSRIRSISSDNGLFAISAYDDNGTERKHVSIDNDGQVGIGTTTPSAKLDVTSTTQGFLPPRMTTTQRDAISTPATGLVIYNTTTNLLNFYNGSSWGAV